MRRTKEDAAITRQRLLAAALAVFVRCGYEGASLDDIAEAAGVTKGSIFHHFGSKAGIYNTLVAESSGRYVDIVEGIFAARAPARDTLRRILAAPLVLAARNEDFRAVQELMFLKTAVTPELEEGMARKIQGIRMFLDRLAEVAEAGIRSGELRQDVTGRDIAVSLFAQQNGLLMLMLLDPVSISVNQQVEHLADIFIQGISAP